MTYKIILLTILSAFIFSFSYGSENLYTWRDEHGVINITDQPPPPGAELIRTTPSHRKEAEEIENQRLLQREKDLAIKKRQEMKEQAALARKREAEARQSADEFMKKAEAKRKIRLRGDYYKEKRFHEEADMYEKKAEEALRKAEEAKKQAEMLEKRLGG